MIIQINLFICDRCGLTSTTTEETSLYDDPVVMPPENEGWDVVEDIGEVCPKCYEEYCKNTK